MDHRCLYGHRVPESFAYAIKNRQCPMCGANTVTVLAYQIARRLNQELQMDALLAFNALRLIEADHALVPAKEAAPRPEPAAVTEIEFPEEEMADTGPVRPAGEKFEVPADLDARKPDPTDLPSQEKLPAPVRSEPTADRDTDFGAVEKDFFESLEA